jgi:polysaccharide pyruvyl transferase WcaK-like protein
VTLAGIREERRKSLATPLTSPIAGHPEHGTQAVPISIALLAPYSGANLGDAAIQEAVIQNVRRRYPDAYISGITANPVFTAARHGIPCFPIAARSLEIASRLQGESEGAARASERSERSSLRARARELAKGVPVVGPVLRRAARVGRWVWAARREVVHLAQGLRFALHLDAIVVAGSGQLDDEWGGAWAHPYALFKWALLSRIAGAQFVVLSVGAGLLRSSMSRWFVRGALRLACYRSYRDPGSKALLRDLPFTHEDRCWPDLAFSLPREEARQSARRGNEGLRCVGVSPIAYGHPQHWPIADRTVHERYLSELTGFVAALAAQERQVVLFATGGVDRLIVRELVARLNAGPQEGISQGSLRVARGSTLEELLAELEGVDGVVASRLHGVILAHLLDKPTLAVSFDRKVAAHMQDMGMERYCLDLHAVDRAALAHTFAQLEQDARSVRAALDDARRAMREALDLQYDAVLHLVVRHHSRRARAWR